MRDTCNRNGHNPFPHLKAWVYSVVAPSQRVGVKAVWEDRRSMVLIRHPCGICVVEYGAESHARPEYSILHQGEKIGYFAIDPETDWYIFHPTKQGGWHDWILSDIGGRLTDLNTCDCIETDQVL